MNELVANNPRILLRQLHVVMAESGDPEALLARVVRLIASNMAAEVCSVYLMGADNVLELFATEGLNAEAVHLTRLRVGEGLTGEIAAHARPLSLVDAQAHPKYAYRPETGEEVYHSFAGVPLLRGGRVLGVLIVQNRTPRNYTDEDVEALQTIAMVLAEMVGSGPLAEPTLFGDGDQAAFLPRRVEGRVLSDGLAMGHAVLHAPRIEVSHTIADDVPDERRRLTEAVGNLRDGIEDMLASSKAAKSGESRDILETYRMFAHDHGWLMRLEAAVDSGLTAEAAVMRVHEETRARMHEVADPYLRERLADLDDLANRLFQHLIGRAGGSLKVELPDQAVLVARDLGPAELLDYDPGRLRAVLLENGSATSHAAIVARALEIPVLGRCDQVTDLVFPGDLIVVDGDHGQAFLRPGENIVEAFTNSLKARAERRAHFAALRDLPAVSKDGTTVSLNINAGLLIDMHHLQVTGADGVGLYRTELNFMVRASMPSIRQQTEYYSRVLDQADDCPVVFRTLDIGGDKLLPYQNADHKEENPAMGWRAIRIALDRPALLRSQLRALLQAAAGRSLSVMFPMVSEVAEFRAARRLLQVELDRLERFDRPRPASLKVGTMLEVPALVWQLPTLLAEIDFLSIGSNDLVQFLFAVDRTSARVADRYDRLSPIVLSLFQDVVRQCERANTPVSLCGDMAGSPLDAMALVGLGFRSVSMPPAAIGPVKQMVRTLDVGRLAAFLSTRVDGVEHSLRDTLEDYAHKEGVVI